MKNYDEMLDDLMWTILDFIFGTKLGHFIFMVGLAGIIVAVLNIFIHFGSAFNIGVMSGVTVSAIYFSWTDDNENWI
jgi:hypothetical protein